MEQERFDQLARSLAAGRSRRGMVRQLAGAAMGGVLAAVGVQAAGAKPHRKPDRKASNHPGSGDAKDHNQKQRAAPPTDGQAQQRKKKRRCPAGQTRCQVGAAKHGKPKKACVDTQTDAKHCGQCATACGSGQTCVAGMCADPCAPQCQGKQCGDDNCGGNCGTCASGMDCKQGQCCPSGQTVCDGRCVDPQTDPTNCGGCGNNCASGNCQHGQCGCAAGLTNCNGQCIATANDPTNCGSCGNVCPGNGPHGQATCNHGACDLSCDPGYSACGGACVDVANDPTNCGACGRICSLPQATAACRGGACVVGTCAAGRADCDNNPSTGCETTLGTPTDCLACGDSCAGFANECNAGLCSDSGCFATPANDGGSCQGGTGTCDTGNCVPNTICVEVLQSCNQGGTACCEGRTCQAFSPGCWGPQYCCRASGESCTNACDCCSVACSGPWVNGAGHCV